jgi:hypothetical protein
MIGSSPLLPVAVPSYPNSHTSKTSEKCCKKDTFLFFPAFRGILMILFRNHCYTATAFIKTREFKRYLKIIDNISGSSSRSSPVAPRSSRVAIDTGQSRTATGFNSLLSIGYKKVAVVAVKKITTYKSWFLLLSRVILTIKKDLVAVLNLLLIVLYQALIVDIKPDCYGIERWVKLFSFARVDLSSSGLLLLFKCQKNILSIVINKIVYKKGKRLLSKVERLSCAVSRLLVLFQVAWREAKKAKWFTAHNYKKCDRQVLDINKINNLQSKDTMKSVVRFGLSDNLNCDRGLYRHPPIEKFQRLACRSYLLLSINCRGILRVFYKVVGQGFDLTGVFGFRKVGGRGE